MLNRSKAIRSQKLDSPEPITLTVSGWAPSKSNSYRIANGRMFKGSPGRAGNAVAEFEVSALRTMLENCIKPLEGWVAVEAMVYPPNLRSDIPGCEKVLLDSLQNWRWGKEGKRRVRVPNIKGYGCYADDKQVRRFVVDFGGVDAANPRIEIIVTPWVCQKNVHKFLTNSRIKPKCLSA